jgi:hypothetical protein
MNAEGFYQRATAVQNKGVMAIFSGGEIRTLTKEAQAAGQRSRDLVRVAIKAGQAPRYCPPEGHVSMNNTEFMARLSAIPAAQRAHIDMTEAMNRIFATKFPCR